jgi:hypothetical protein
MPEPENHNAHPWPTIAKHDAGESDFETEEIEVLELDRPAFVEAVEFKVQRKMCESCIYKPDSPLDIKHLESQIADRFGGFKGHRVCHHSTDACCSGFWRRHKDKFPLGQIAQRLGMVVFVEEDEVAMKGMSK